MRKLIVATVLALTTTAAYAYCTTHSYFVNGRYMICTTCCYSGNCTTNCI